MYENKLPKYYDSLYTKKPYKSECEFIKKNIPSGNILDVGCGTMTHSIILSKNYDSIVGVDLSVEMTEMAERKIKNNNIKNISIINNKLDNISFEKKFDGVISMFNVVNHIEKINDLITFFEKINESLVPNGKFIFDCWNGIASTIDPPHNFSRKEVYDGYHTLVSETVSETDLMSSITVMKTKVTIYDDISKIDEFEYEIRQKLWTPNLLFQILNMTGFNEVKLIPFFKESEIAKDTDYRLTFICIK